MPDFQQINFSFNFVVYLILNGQFRRSMIDLICCIFCCCCNWRRTTAAKPSDRFKAVRREVQPMRSPNQKTADTVFWYSIKRGPMTQWLCGRVDKTCRLHALIVLMCSIDESASGQLVLGLITLMREKCPTFAHIPHLLWFTHVDKLQFLNSFNANISFQLFILLLRSRHGFAHWTFHSQNQW